MINEKPVHMSIANSSCSCCALPAAVVTTIRLQFRAVLVSSMLSMMTTKSLVATAAIRHSFRMTLPAFLPPSFAATATAAAWIPSPNNRKQTRSRLFSTHSKRGSDAVTLLPTYLADARAVEQYCPNTCPGGALQLGVAENQMLEDLLVPALTEFASSRLFTADLIYYQPTHGRPGVRVAFSNYLQRLLKLGTPPNPDGLVVGAGCNAVLENLCMCLADPGQAVLIPTPYYAAFEFDLAARANLKIVPVNTVNDDNSNDETPPDGCTYPPEAYYPRRSVLDAAYSRACETGNEPRILLLSHPNNPLAICYPPHVVKECIDWCREHQIHLVSDEIYAGSVFGGSNVFKSALGLAGGVENLGDYIHFVYALSKDFALSGLRVGAVYSENQHIRTPLQKLNDLCQISSQTQVLVETMLTSKVKNEYWTDIFLRENNARIRARCHKLQTCLEECGIPFLEAEAGLFVWMDFSQFLSSSEGNNYDDDDEERERVLYNTLMKDYGLLFTPGLSMRNKRPGFFRFVFSAATDDEFALSLQRIREFAKKSQLS